MKRFKIVTTDTNEDVMGGELSEDNVYIKTYGVLVEPGSKPVHELEVGESTLKKYSLSGGKATVYKVVRVE